MGFGTCCGETSLTAFAVRSGKPVMTCSSRVRAPDRSGVPAGCGVGAGGGVGAGVGGGVGAGGSAGGCEAGGGFVSLTISNLSIPNLGVNSGITVGNNPRIHSLTWESASCLASQAYQTTV